MDRRREAHGGLAMNKCIYCEKFHNQYKCNNPNSGELIIHTRCTKAKHECNQFNKGKY